VKKISSKSLLYFANAYILLSICYYWLETSVLFNPVATVLFVIFGLHLFAAKGNAKLLFPIIFGVINLYMVFALFSEFSEFPSITKDAIIMMTVGILYLGLNLFSAIVMILNTSNLPKTQLGTS